MNILIIGSGPNAIEARSWDRSPFDRIVVINNAWRVRDDWDDMIFPYDFADQNKPARIEPHQRFITEADFVPAQNSMGGFVYAGATMAFTAGYWCLAAFSPQLIGFAGCNMYYPDSGDTHFYGTGTPDPMRDDISLTSLKACSYRMMAFAGQQGCNLVSLSSGETNLSIPQIDHGAVATYQPEQKLNRHHLKEALKMEQKLDYHTPDGRYWENLERYDRASLEALDQIWMKVFDSDITPDMKPGSAS